MGRPRSLPTVAELLARMEAVDWAAPILDRPRAETALREFCARNGYSPAKVAFAANVSDMFAIRSMGRALPHEAIEETGLLSPGGLSGLAVDVLSGMVTWALRVVRNWPQRQYWETLGLPNVGPTFGGSPVFLTSLTAAGCLVAADMHERRPVVFRGAGIDIAAVLPMLEVIEAGVGAFWLAERGLVALAQPALHIEGDRLHRADGPAAYFRDGDDGRDARWFWRGVHVPREVVEAPETITPVHIHAARNTEMRRLLIERFGSERYAEQCGRVLDHDDRWGTLYGVMRETDTPLLMLRVVNRTPEPDGSFRQYWLRIHPRCRPLSAETGELGPAQMPTALNAVASTFGMTGEAYARALGAES